MIQGKKNFIIFILILFVSFSANYYYGSIGVFPIDSFAFYDSANLINKGFLPIRDFWSSNGFFVDLVQSFFFNIFGVNWKIYLLHSSLLNFLFSWVTYKFLIHEGLARLAVYYGYKKVRHTIRRQGTKVKRQKISEIYK